MSQKIFIGPITKGLDQFYLPFNISNDSFPTLYNAYTWRGRVKRKRGTVSLARAQRQVKSVLNAAPPLSWQYGQIATLDGAGSGSANLISVFSLETTGSITPGSINLTDGTNAYTEPANPNGTLSGSPGGSGTINYATGALTITGGAPAGVLRGVATAGTPSYSYYPNLPILGLRDFTTTSSQYPLLLTFDKKYSYQISTTGSNFYNVSYYKGTNNPVTWNGANYQQFWTSNYQGALWSTNNNGGMIFEAISTITAGNPTIITTATAHGLVTGDYVWFNEITGTDSNLLNLQALQITKTGATTFTVAVDTTAKVLNNNGIFQILTNNPNVAANTGAAKDGIKWYDGDCTGASGIPSSTSTGWVNFAPPLTASTVSIDDEIVKKYYLVGALAVVPYKDRLLFFSPWIQASTGAAVQLNDVVIWSWNGTPYYTSTGTTSPYTAVLVPTTETADPTAYYVDQTGKGGWISAGIDQSIVTVNNNEDVLIVGFTSRQTRFIYTGNDLFPFLFYLVNAELGSASTFSGVTLDRGALSFGLNGLLLTSQTGSQRIDIAIPNEVFQIKAESGGTPTNAAQRISAVRDYYHEWVHFTFIPDTSQWTYPTQTLQYNYREESWGLFYENFTAQGHYRKQSGYTWSTIPFNSWSSWNEPWNSSLQIGLFQSVVAGNPQGFVVIKGEGTGEGQSGYISAIATDPGGSGLTQITSNDHCMAVGDYLYFEKSLGTTQATITGISKATQAVITAANTFIIGQVIFISGVSGMTQINGLYVTVVSATASSITINLDTTGYSAYTSGGLAIISPLSLQVYQVQKIVDSNNFLIDLKYTNYGYIGLGVFSRLSQPLIQTKEFPVYWKEGRKIRIGPQKYLLDYTDNAQVTLLIYLSQDSDTAWNNVEFPKQVALVPSDQSLNNSLIYSTTLYTCPESTNLGLTSANTNLQQNLTQIVSSSMVSNNQYQIWHRQNTSLIGDTFQVGITLNDTQMRNYNYATAEITLHAMQFDVSPGPLLS